MWKISLVNKILDYLAAAFQKFYFLLILAFYCLLFPGEKKQISKILIDILMYSSHKTLHTLLWNVYPPPKKGIESTRSENLSWKSINLKNTEEN